HAKMRFLILLTCLLAWNHAYPHTVRVGTNQAFKTIRAGIDAAKPGDTVLVDKGHYREKNLIIRKMIVLSGIGYPVLDGENKYEVISAIADNLVIEGFRIINSGISGMEDLSGIRVYDSRNVTVRNNILENTFFGIYIQN